MAKQKEKKQNPKVSAALQRAFYAGSIGHQLRSPVAQNDPLLRQWVDVHGAEMFLDAENRVVGLLGCFCPECLPMVVEFVCSGHDLISQAAGDETFLRNNDDQCQCEVRDISMKDAQLETRIARLCADLSLQISERVAEQVATRVARQEARGIAEVAKAVAGGFARQAFTLNASSKDS